MDLSFFAPALAAISIFCATTAFAAEEGRVIRFCHLPTGQMLGMAKVEGKPAHATLFSQEEVKFMRFTSDGPCGPKERDFIVNRTAMSHLSE